MRANQYSRIISIVINDVIISAPAAPGLWTRVFPVVYDPFLWAGERTGARALRHELVGQALGRTVEIGAGTGLNLPHYADHLDDLILAEPDAAMRSRLGRRLQRAGGRGRIIEAPSERLPFSDGSIDTVISTFVLCTVDDPELALSEIMRVLRPDGQLLFLEHVRSESPGLAHLQDRLAGPWHRFAKGCRCNRPTAELVASSGLRIDELHRARWHAMPPIVRPLISGRATKGTGNA